MRQFNEMRKVTKSRFLSSITRRGPAISIDIAGQGYIEKVTPFEGKTRLRGWYTGPPLDLLANGISTSIKRSHLRQDVCTVLGISDKTVTGFDILVPPGLSVKIQPQNSNQRQNTKIPLYSKPDKYWAIFDLIAFFPKLAFSNPVTILRYLLWSDRKAADVLEKAFLPPVTSVKYPGFDMSIFDKLPKSHPAYKTGDTTIVLPVFNSFELLQECLTRVVAHTEQPYKIVVIEDCSTDTRIKPWLRNWAKSQGKSVTLLENNQNIGFIGSVNRGLMAAKGSHIVLLNSDALVPQGWLPRLMAPILADNNVASATPLSNNAEILSVPLIGKENPISEGAVDRIDQIACDLNGKNPFVEIPTGIGFCMAMNQTYLQKIPRLDKRFGKGYGEEVDWCQKTRAIGGKHIAVTNLFVHHVGGESFGSEKQSRLAKNNAVISRLYPRFDQMVCDFAMHDPLVSTRFALGIPTIDTGKPVPIFLAHELGGGTEVYLQDRIKKELEKGQGVIVLRDATRFSQYVLELYTPNGSASVLVADIAKIAKLLQPLRTRKFIYSCIVGYRDPVGFLENIRAIIDPVDDSLSVQIHDFFPICPSYNLLDMNNNYCGLPQKPTCATCFQKKAHTANLTVKNISEWRQIWHNFLEQADTVETFSASSKAIFEKAYPEHAAKISVMPHKLPVVPGRVNRQDHGRLTVGVLGNIGLNKGGDFISRAAKANISDGRLIVFGALAPEFMHNNIKVTGNYGVEGLAALAQSNKIDCWLIPSIWPETFSYTTHEAIETGLPVFCFGLGAQAEAVKKAKNGFIINQNPNELFHQIESVLQIGSTRKTIKAA